MATLSQLRSRVARRVGFDTALTEEQEAIDDALNRGYVDVLVRTKAQVDSTSVTPGATDDYTLGSGVLAILDLYFTVDSQRRNLHRTTPSDILERRRAGSGTTGSTRYYALAGHDMLMFYPTPGASDSLTYYYVARPATLTASDSPSALPAEWHHLLELYAAAECADIDDDNSSNQGERYRKDYELELIRFKKAMRNKGGSKLPRAQIGRGVTRVAPTPSTDW